jgi:hypothetical protein
MALTFAFDASQGFPSISTAATADADLPSDAGDSDGFAGAAAAADGELAPAADAPA